MPNDDEDIQALTALLPSQQGSSPPAVDSSQLGPGNQQALSDVMQTPSAQPRSTIPSSPLGSPVMPNIVRFISGMVNPQTQSTQGSIRPPSRLDVFESFLGNFLGSMAMGLQQSGRGPGANARGFGYALTGAPQLAQQQELTQSEIQGRQAQAAETQARAGLTQRQTELAGQSIPVTLPNGQQIFIPASQSGNLVKGMAAAQVNAQSKMSVEQLKTNILLGRVARVLDGKDENGNLAKLAYNSQGQLLGTVSGALASSAYLPKATKTTEFKEDANGNIVALPKTTVSGPMTGGAGAPADGSTPPAPRSGFPRGPRAGGPITASPVMGTDGQPLAGKTGNESVYAVDPDSQKIIPTTRADAVSRGLTAIQPVTPAIVRSDMHDVKVLNDVAAKANNLIDSADALNQNMKQLNIIANALNAGKDDNEWRLHLFGTGAPTAGFNATLDAFHMDEATQKTKDYITNVLSLRESSMGLQRVLTGTARANESQIKALQATLPGLETDGAMARQKLAAFTQNIEMLRGGLPDFSDRGLKTIELKPIPQNLGSQSQSQPSRFGTAGWEQRLSNLLSRTKGK
ncbi:MAG TPA: hypothetical protein VNX88_12930 [Terriglobales bacterium]|jgi:hypothetical protein|nr:hypothetical protein [Terriglobales bacterium]